jgi:hypothetical protein
MIIKYGFPLTVLLFAGCKTDNNKKLVEIITSNCYWDIHDIYSAANQRIAYCYKFNKDGSCLYLFTPDKKGKRNEYDDDDVVAPKKWELKGDSILYIRGIQRRVINFSTDTLLLENPVNKVRDTLIRDCN